MRTLIFSLISFLLLSCGFEKTGIAQDAGQNQTSSLSQVKVYETFDELAPLFQKQNDTVYLVNFWATTCPPCIKEMPHFLELAKRHAEKKLRIVLISLDLKKHLESRVTPFVKKHSVTLETGLLADDNYSEWTDKIDSSWYGALPATLIFKNEKRAFKFGAFADYEDLENAIRPFVEE